MLYWEAYYSIQFIIEFVIVGVLLAIATCLTLTKMRTSFGPDSLNEERMIKFTLIVFCASYALRVTEYILVIVFVGYTEEYDANNSTHNLIKLISWALWDLLPILCMYIVHFYNFSSFMKDEILYCEYSEDGRSSAASYARLLFQDLDNDGADSIYKGQLVTSNSEFYSKVELSSSSDSDEPPSPLADAYAPTRSLQLQKSKTSRKRKKKKMSPNSIPITESDRLRDSSHINAGSTKIRESSMR